MKRIDFLNLFLIIIIIYYLLRGKDIVEGSDNSNKCSNFDTCKEYPYEYKSGGDTLGQDQCLDGSVNCDENEKIIRCCQNKTDVCQGNIDSTKDIVCEDGSWPKVDSNNIPYECDGSDDETENCWREGGRSLSELTNEEQQNICCTSRNDFLLAEQFWGIPYLISKASKSYDDSKILRNDGTIDEADELLNEALKMLHEAKELDTSGRYGNIPSLINDWGNESGFHLGSGMCIGNIDQTTDIECPNDQSYVDQPFIKTGSDTDTCCLVSGFCVGNTAGVGDISCPDGMTIKPGVVQGTTIEECCDREVTCRGNTNVNLNFNCPPPLIPVINSNTKKANTKEECCRHPEEKDETELEPTSMNETISGTVVINADLMQNAGAEGSSKRKIFINNFQEDISEYINNLNKLNLSPNQVIINKISRGSIIIDFKIIPDNITGISISKEYFSFIFNKEIPLPKIGHSISSISNVRVISWYNLEYWPPWAWYVVVSIITFLIVLIIFV